LEQRGQQRPIGGLETDLLPAELALHHGELVAQGQDLCILVPITAGQQPQHREHVHHTEVCQPEEHEATSSRSRYRPAHSSRIAHDQPAPSARP
jgi:hypothetical protein